VTSLCCDLLLLLLRLLCCQLARAVALVRLLCQKVACSAQNRPR
jgi:hypothetical protein